MNIGDLESNVGDALHGLRVGSSRVMEDFASVMIAAFTEQDQEIKRLRADLAELKHKLTGRM